MRIYQAALNLRLILAYHERFPDQKINVLRSFGRLKAEEKDICLTHRDKVGSVILDSGTYTLNFTKNPDLTISIDTYESYLRAFGGDYDFYFNFDSDFSPQGFPINQAHQRRLERAGLKPVPVIHDICGDEVEYFIDRGYEIVAIGSQEKDLNALYLVTDRLFQAGVKVHLFGTTKYNYLVNLPLFSCDSTTGTKTGAYGSILYWNPHKKDVDKTDVIYVEEYLHDPQRKGQAFSTYAFRTDLEKYLEQTLGISRGDFYGPDANFYKALVNLDFFVRLEERLNLRKEA